ncbi:MAG: DUF1192 domain-containing protein [Acidibrevibacterium sp.]|uniref:DUF1192 domain-containing protein n=1 Tax=Acidibrevibacterium sp. TaxID=2606776 RepID=UPI003D08CDAA
MLDDEDLPKPPRQRLAPLPLDALGIVELRAYIAELKGEIARTEAEISRKERHRDAVEGLFRTSRHRPTE